MSWQRQLRALDGGEFESMCLYALNRPERAASGDLPFRGRGAMFDADQGVDIENLRERSGFQCKTGRVNAKVLAEAIAAVAKYPHPLVRFVILCTRPPTPSANTALERLRSTCKTAAGPVPRVEMWGPDELFQQFGTHFFIGLPANAAARTALLRHATALREEFEAPGQGTLQPSLAQTYVDIDCGEHLWGEIQESRAKGGDLEIDPFSERSAPRKDLLQAVLPWLAKDDFHELIVIQGTPGAGKSSFTIRLALHLAATGYSPIRIRLRDLPLVGRDTVADIASIGLGLKREELYAVFALAGSCIVLILDGWDELTLAADHSLSERIGTFITSVRSSILKHWRGRIKVVITGRPSHAATRDQTMTANTPLLTIRKFTPEQLSEYFGKLRTVSSPADGHGHVDVDGILRKYREDWAADRELPGSANRGTLDVIGWPFLARLAYRLLLQCEPSRQLGIVEDATMLLRCLTEYYCQHSRNPADGAGGVEILSRFNPAELRGWIHETAIAMTARNAECMSLTELRDAMKARAESGVAESLTRLSNTADNLLVNFFFKSRSERRACEFVHKSLREFAFAEAVIDALKPLGVATKSKRHALELEEQQPHTIARLLSAQWLTTEVWNHLVAQLLWEILREQPRYQDPEAFRRVEPPLGLDAWCRVRDRLAALWADWEVHNLTPPGPAKADPQVVAMGMVDYAFRDSRLGDALFRLCAALHGMLAQQIVRADNIPLTAAAIWEDHGVVAGDHPHQVVLLKFRDQRLRFFSPFRSTEDDARGLRTMLARINAHRSDIAEELPGKCDLSFVTLIGAPLERLSFRFCNLSYCNLQESDLSGADLQGAEIKDAMLQRVNLERANLKMANLRGADLHGARLAGAVLQEANLAGADLRKVRGLTVSQVLAADKFMSATFDPDFREALRSA
jgi:hypothetical protein